MEGTKVLIAGKVATDIERSHPCWSFELEQAKEGGIRLLAKNILGEICLHILSL
jgi:hypothetical protein